MPTKHLVIHGRVQGVWYRRSFANKCQELGVKGRIRNLPDGCVEATIEASEEILSEIVKWAHEGPPLAKVTKVEISSPADEENFDSFEVLY